MISLTDIINSQWSFNTYCLFDETLYYLLYIAFTYATYAAEDTSGFKVSKILIFMMNRFGFGNENEDQCFVNYNLLKYMNLCCEKNQFFSVRNSKYTCIKI